MNGKSAKLPNGPDGGDAAEWRRRLNPPFRLL